MKRSNHTTLDSHTNFLGTSSTTRTTINVAHIALLGFYLDMVIESMWLCIICFSLSWLQTLYFVGVVLHLTFDLLTCVSSQRMFHNNPSSLASKVVHTRYVVSSELVLATWDSGSLRLTRQAIKYYLLADSEPSWCCRSSRSVLVHW